VYHNKTGELMFSMLILSLVFHFNAQANLDAKTKLVEESIRGVNALRETMVLTLPEDTQAITPKDFKASCGQVGIAIKRLSKKHQFTIRQASHKFRNPQHKPTKIEEEALRFFVQTPNQNKFWKEDVPNERHFFQKIVVKQSCLKCHGEKLMRPPFVQRKYPKDNAYGFKVGDLRGLYHVIIKKD
jgi:hypothetical protein